MSTLTKTFHSMLALSLVISCSLLSCGGGEGEGERVLTSVPEEVSMGALRPAKDGEEDLGSNDRVPFERVILLRATGGQPVEISNICLVGDGANQFVLEGPKPSTASASEDAAVRVTYERQNEGGPDQIALIVESNATTPTLIVPICARVVQGGSDDALECEPPEETSCP